MRNLLMLVGTVVVCALMLVADGASAQENKITRVSVESPGIELQCFVDFHYGGSPSISADGQFVVFGCRNYGSPQWVLVHDQYAGTTERLADVSEFGDYDTAGGLGMSRDGRYVVFTAFLHDPYHDVPGKLLLHDRESGETKTIAEGVSDPSISGDGRYVAFASERADLVSDDTDAWSDVFVIDTQSGQTTLVSAMDAGSDPNGFADHPSISGDSRYVAFEYGIATKTTESGESRTTVRDVDVFLRDLETGRITLVSAMPDGSESNDSDAWDSPSVSEDGRYVAFSSEACCLAAGDTDEGRDIFVRDLEKGKTEMVSVGPSGWESNAYSYQPSISRNGRYVLFGSEASNLVANDTNHDEDLFVRDRQEGQTVRVTSNWWIDDEYDIYLGSSPMSADGQYVAFVSQGDIPPEDTNENADVFVADLGPRESSETSGGENGGAKESGDVDADAGAAPAVDKSSSRGSGILVYLVGAGTILLIGSGVWYVRRRWAQ